MWQHLYFRPNGRTGEKRDLSDHEMIFGGRQGGLSISETAIKINKYQAVLQAKTRC